MKSHLPPLLAMLFALSCPTLQALASQAAVKLRLGALHLDDPRDNGQQNERSDELYVDSYLSLLTNYSPAWSSYARVQGFWSGDSVFVDTEQGTDQAGDRFWGVRELWLDYSGLTSYPGESLRLGRQRLQMDDGLWADRDIEALQWLFVTTTLQGRIGIAEALTDARSDDPGINALLHRQTLLLGETNWQYARQHYLQTRLALTRDRGDSDDPASTQDGAALDRDMQWLGATLHNDFYRYRQLPQLGYALQIMGQTGKQRRLIDAAGDSATQRREDVQASAADVLLRWTPQAQGPLRLGLGYAMGSGGLDSDGDSEQFSQTGLHSNRSRFTGTRSKLYRYNEALRPDLSNIEILSAFVAVQLARTDISLIAHQFNRQDASGPIAANGLQAEPSTPNHDLGHGFDLIAAWYFEQLARLPMGDEDSSANVRVRGSMFETGPAFLGIPDKARGVVEVTAYF